MENNSLQSIHIKRFKNINDAPFNLSEINVLIGANNSGKSSVVQIIHFAVGILQSVNLLNRWGKQTSVSRSLSPDDLMYSPCADLLALGYGGRLKEREEQPIEISLRLSSGQEVSVKVRKGRNRNINASIDNVEAARMIANLEEPFTIFSPGLAGIARYENYVSNGVLLRTIARGDANLVLRNILLRLSQEEQSSAWNDFIQDLAELFPEIFIDVKFDYETDEHINVYVDSGSGKVPIELAGTGILQTIQILSYVHYFHPSVILLDEPDSHLHPNNQRLLCQLLQTVAEERSTQVLLTTHSRHVVDALSGLATFLWVRQGTIEAVEQSHDLAVLLDIGALDVKELLSHAPHKCLVLTEDERKRHLETLLTASDFPMEDTLVLAYYGCTSPHNLRPLIELIQGTNNRALILVHRDRDYLTDEECIEWQEKIQNMHAEAFLTQGVDVESHFLNAKHILELNSISETDAQLLLDEASESCKRESIEKYVNGRMDIEKKKGTFGKLNFGQFAIQAPRDYDSDPFRYRHSKTVMKRLRHLFREKYGRNLRIDVVTKHIAASKLQDIAKKITR